MPHLFDEISTELKAFVRARDWGQFHTPRSMAICVSVEASELLEHYTWVMDSPEGPPPSATSPDPALIADEAADVLLSLLSFCDVTEIDLLASARAKLRRLETKYPVAVSKGSAVKDPLGT